MNNFNKYLDISSLNKKWGFYVNTVGFNKSGPNTVYPNNKKHPADHSFNWDKGRILDGYYIVFITKGQGIFESEHTSSYNLLPGMCFFLFPGVWHRYKPNLNTGWEEYWVGFKGSYPDLLMNNGFFNVNAPFINTGFNEDLLLLFHKLLDTVKSADVGYHQAIAGITFQILGLLYTISVHKEQSKNPTERLIAKAKVLMQESIEQSIDFEELAKELPMGYSRFRKAFKRLTNQSPNQYHLNLRLNKAKELLSSTNLTVNEISYQTGFESVSYFSKLFKQKNGMPPKAHRLEIIHGF